MTGYTILGGFLIFFFLFIYLTWFGFSIKVENCLICIRLSNRHKINFGMLLNVKSAFPKHGISWGGENVLFIKNVFYYSNDIKVNTLNRDALGASFELYSMFLRHLEHIKKIKQFHLSDPILAGVLTKFCLTLIFFKGHFKQ